MTKFCKILCLKIEKLFLTMGYENNLLVAIYSLKVSHNLEVSKCVLF